MNRGGWACRNVCSQFREVVVGNVSICTGENYLDSGILQENNVFYSICILNIHNNPFCACLDVVGKIHSLSFCSQSSTLFVQC